jgi:uncharacterized protein (DUF58 family)
MDTRELLKKVRRIEIKTNRLSSHLFSGEYHSSFKGRGMSFSEVRAYQYGDDIRSIDWNVTARLREPYVKVFEEERELTLMIVADISGSGDFGTQGQLRREITTEIGATLAFSALQNNDKVGLLLFSDGVERYIPPRKGRSQVLRIIREMIEYSPKSKKTNIRVALEYLNAVQRKKGIVFLLSDYLDGDYQKALSLTARKHDLVGIRLKDSFEKKMPNLGVIPVFDAETQSQHWVDFSSSRIRRKYELWMQSMDSYFTKSFRSAGADQLEVELGTSYIHALLGFFKKRNKR